MLVAVAVANILEALVVVLVVMVVVVRVVMEPPLAVCQGQQTEVAVAVAVAITLVHQLRLAQVVRELLSFAIHLFTQLLSVQV